MCYNDNDILEEFLVNKQHTAERILAHRGCANATTPSYLCALPGEADQIDNGYLWLDNQDVTKATELRFKIQTFQKFMKKMGSNWGYKECTNFLQSGGATPSKKHDNIQTRHWRSPMPKIQQYKNKEVRHEKKSAPWQDN